LNERLVVQLEQETKGRGAAGVPLFAVQHEFGAAGEVVAAADGTVLRRRATELMQKGVPEARSCSRSTRCGFRRPTGGVDLRLFFIMTKLADQFGIEVNEEEVNARITEIAMQYGRRPEKLRSQMSASGSLSSCTCKSATGRWSISWWRW